MSPLFLKGNKLLGNKAFYKEVFLANHICDAIDSRIANKDPTITKPFFSTFNHATSSYVRNVDNWAYDIDSTCISVWNSTTNSGAMAGTLISPRHILMAAHYQINTNATLRFVTKNNTVITRTLTNKLTHPDYYPIYPDITIGLLDSDLPNTIKPAKMFRNSDWVAKTGPNQNVNVPIFLPVLCLDQTKKAIVREWTGQSQAAIPPNPVYPTSLFWSPVNPTRSLFSGSITTGDSGSPIFFIINNELVLASVWTTSINGTWLANHIDAINTMMTSLGGGYQVSVVDLNYYFTNV